jgi:hypothetical protein
LLHLFKQIYVVAELSETRLLLRHESLLSLKSDLIPPSILETLARRDADEVMSELLVKITSGKISRRLMTELRKSVSALHELFSVRQLPAMRNVDVDLFVKDKVLKSRRIKLEWAPLTSELAPAKKRRRIEAKPSRDLFLVPESPIHKPIAPSKVKSETLMAGTIGTLPAEKPHSALKLIPAVKLSLFRPTENEARLMDPSARISTHMGRTKAPVTITGT